MSTKEMPYAFSTEARNKSLPWKPEFQRQHAFPFQLGNPWDLNFGKM